MSINIPTFYVQQYSSNLQLLLQQKGSRLRNSVMTGTHVGRQASPVDQLAALAANKVSTRFAPMGRVDATTDRRWVFPVDYDLPQLIDQFDRLRLLVDPNSQYVTNGVYAMGRAMDDEVIGAYFGTAKTGVDGSVSTSFPAGQVVSVQQGAAAPTGLTVAKLREAKRILMANQIDIDNDPLYAVVKAKQHDNLLAETQIVSTEFNEKPVLVDGRVHRFLGINILYCERLQSGTDDQAGTSDAIPVYSKSGMYLGVWGDIQTDVSQRKDLQSLPWQAYAYGTFGATRLEEKRVVKVWCR